MKRNGANGFLLVVGCSLLTLCGGCKRVWPPTPLDQLNAQQKRGHQYFESHCSACHYDRQSGPLHGPSLMSVFKRRYLPSGAPANDGRVTATILDGHNLMPAQPNTTQQDLDDLLKYLHTL